MKKIYIAVLILGCLLPLSAQAADPVEGYWLTENKRSVIRIEECPQGICGFVHWIIEGGMQYDAKNPDPGKQGEPMCGLPILWGFDMDEPGEWEDGNIYKADDGDIYSAEVEIEDDGTLYVRGYMGISLLGKSQSWTRVDPAQYPACKTP